MIITLPIVPANFRNLRLGDEILFRFFKEHNGFLVPWSDALQKVKKLDLSLMNYKYIGVEDSEYNLHEGCFILKENTEFPFGDEIGSEIGKYPSHIYRCRQGYYAFLFARLQTEDKTGRKIAKDFADRLEGKEEQESYDYLKAFLKSYDITVLDSLVAEVDAIRPQ